MTELTRNCLAHRSSFPANARLCIGVIKLTNISNSGSNVTGQYFRSLFDVFIRASLQTHMDNGCPCEQC